MGIGLMPYFVFLKLWRNVEQIEIVGDEVLVQSFTFCASSHPITYLGAKPVFVGSEGETWNMDPVLLLRLRSA